MPLDKTTIVTEFVVKTEQATKDVQELTAKIQDVHKTAQASGTKVSQTLTGKMGFTQTTKEAEQMRMKITQTFKEASSAKDKFKSNLGSLGSVAKVVFGTILGLSAVGILRSIIGYFKEAAESALEFARAVYSMQIGVRALQRSGVEITIQDVTANIEKLRQEFGIFSEKELVIGTAALLNLTRSFGYTKEEIFAMQEAIATLAIVNNRAMDEVQRIVALAISSGYTEGLQRLGVSINRITIAEEAARLGYADNYNALTEVQRAQATYNVILERTALYSNDVASAQEQMFGKLQKSQKELDDLNKEAGNVFIPLWTNVQIVITKGAYAIVRAFQAITTVISYSIAGWAGLFVFLANTAKQAWDVVTGKASSVDVVGALREGYNTVKSVIEEFRKSIWEEELPKLPDLPTTPKPPEEFTDEQIDAYDKLFKEMYDLREDYNKKESDLAEKHADKMEELEKDHVDNLLEIWEDYQRERAEINQKAAEDTAKENEDYADRLRDLDNDTRKKIEDAQRKYRENELKAERDYQEKLRRLREEFLFDLEDALRERDALQVLRLIRRYKLDLAQLQAQKEAERLERQEALQQELDDIRRQREEKLAELRMEHQERLQEIEQQRQRELEEARLKYEEQKAEEEQAYAERKAEEEARYAQDLEDLKVWLQERLNEIAANFLAMEGITQEMANSLTGILNKVFGPGGTAEFALNNFNAMINNAVVNALQRQAELNSILQSINSMSAAILGGQAVSTTSGSNPSFQPPVNTGIGSSYGHASGFHSIVSKPYRFVAGEVPEKIDITPLSQMNSNPNGSATKVEVWLSSGLEAEIVDQTLDQAATIFRDAVKR